MRTRLARNVSLVAVLCGLPAAAGAADRCGGVVLEPVRVSVLADIPCVKFMVPAKGFTGHHFHVPARHVSPLYAPPPDFPRPYREMHIAVPFDFGRSFLVYQLGDYYVNRAVAYARASHARRCRTRPDQTRKIRAMKFPFLLGFMLAAAMPATAGTNPDHATGRVRGVLADGSR